MFYDYIQDYFSLQKEYEKKFGPKTLVLYEFGSHYNAYQYDPDECGEDGEKLGGGKKISELLGLKYTLFNGKQPHSKDNLHLVGFPHNHGVFEKYKRILLDHNYTIIQVNEVGINSKGKKIREVTNIHSPCLEYKPNQIDNNILVVYIECNIFDESKFSESLLSCGISVLDTITGESFLYEYYSEECDRYSCIQNIYKIIISTQPRKISIFLNDFPEEYKDSYSLFLSKEFTFENLEICKDFPKVFGKISYQENILNKIFRKDNDYIDIINQLDLDNYHYARIAYTLCLDFCHEHSPTTFYSIDYPKISQDTSLVIAHNSLKQLSIFELSNDLSLFKLLDRNVTKMGSRRLKDLLRNPMIDSEELNEKYDVLCDCINLKIESKSIYFHIIEFIEDIGDISSYFRKINNNTIKPNSFVKLYNWLLQILELYYTLCSKDSKIKDLCERYTHVIEDVEQFIENIEDVFEISSLETSEMVTRGEEKDRIKFQKLIFVKKYHENITKKYKKYKTLQSRLKKIVDHLNFFITDKKGTNIEIIDSKNKTKSTSYKEGIVLILSEYKFNILKSSNYDSSLTGDIYGFPYKGNKKIVSSNIIEDYSEVIAKLKDELENKFFEIYKTIIRNLSLNYKFFNEICKFIAELDNLQSFSKISLKYKYFKPQIIDSDSSFLDVKDIRHPLIERIIDDEYITNDLKLKESGMLLFGLNQIGKSSLAKAVALNIVMAQIGCFTACKMEYSPFMKIITRLNGDDNIHKGKSTFANEMSELRTILRQSDKNTLVIGDEIAHSSEIVSGISITASAILKLINVNCSFIFATHMHDILKLDDINTIPNEKLRVCHLSAIIKNKTLIYSRKIKNGPGEKIYGVLVCENLGLPSDFIETAYQISNKILNSRQLVKRKKSRYNSNVFMDHCKLCKSTKKLHTHHIKEQRFSDSDGMINHYHKDSKGNLIVLCESCHTKLHKDKKKIIIKYKNGKKIYSIVNDLN